MKRILTCIVLVFMIFSSALLTGCDSYAVDDSIQIESITNDLMSDGRTRITITYVDNIKSPDVFYIAQGEQGEIGETGNGIKEITYAEDELTGDTIVTITFTDESVEPVVFTVRNGLSILGIDTYVDEVTGDNCMLFKYSNGTYSEPIVLPQGKAGIGIKTYEQIVNEDKSVDTKFVLDDGREITITIPAPQEGNGIESMAASISADRTEYIITVTYTNGRMQDLFLPCPKEPSNWYSGQGKPSDREHLNGDYYFDLQHHEIYFKEDGYWTKIVSFETNEKVCEVAFDLNDIDDANSPALMEGLKTYRIKYGTVFADNGYEIPVPARQGYTFKGWYTSRSETATAGKLTTLTPIFSDVTFYAVWEKNQLL